MKKILLLLIPLTFKFFSSTALEPLLPTAFFISNAPVCKGQMVYFTDLSSVPSPPFGYITTWVWDFGDGSPFDTIHFPNNPNIAHLYSGLSNLYPVTLYVTDNNGDSDDYTAFVTLYRNPVANFYATTPCRNSPVGFVDLSQMNGGGPVVQWNWNFGDPGSGIQNTSTLQTPFHLFPPADSTYPVSLVVSNANNCSDTIIQPVHISPGPLPDFHHDTACLGSPVSMWADTSVINTGSVMAWSWNFGDGSPNVSTPDSTQHIYAAVGTYTVTLTITDQHYCPDSVSHQVLVNPQPAAAGSITGSGTVVQGQTGVPYNVTSIANALGYMWTLPAGATITSGDNTNSIIVSFSASASSGVMSVHGTNACGNGAESAAFPIAVTSSVPSDLTVTDEVHAGEIKCYNALQTITVAGSGTIFSLEAGGRATFIAGQNILFLPGTTVQPGGYMRAYITTTGNYCGTLAPSIVTVATNEVPLPKTEQVFFKVYPNPTNGKFTLELTGVDETSDFYVDIYTMRGESMQKTKLTGETKSEFTLEENPPGIYILRIINKEMAGTAKIILQ